MGITDWPGRSEENRININGTTPPFRAERVDTAEIQTFLERAQAWLSGQWGSCRGTSLVDLARKEHLSVRLRAGQGMWVAGGCWPLVAAGDASATGGGLEETLHAPVLHIRSTVFLLHAQPCLLLTKLYVQPAGKGSTQLEGPRPFHRAGFG